jgi:catechol 2,3-dioxygenase-like lactoylglutathione lyase family enzyme
MFAFHHITISSKDVSVSVKFYERLGFKTALL